MAIATAYSNSIYLTCIGSCNAYERGQNSLSLSIYIFWIKAIFARFPIKKFQNNLLCSYFITFNKYKIASKVYFWTLFCTFFIDNDIVCNVKLIFKKIKMFNCCSFYKKLLLSVTFYLYHI